MKLVPVTLPIFLITLCLTSCLSMPISTMYKMSQLTVLGLNPSEIRVAIRTNKLVSVKNGAAEIGFNAKTDGVIDDNVNADLKQKLPVFDHKYKFRVEAMSSTQVDFSSLFTADIEEDEQITILKLSNEDAQVMAESLTLIKSYKAKGAKVTGGFSVGTNSNCFQGLNKFEALEVDVFLQTDIKEDFMIFLEDIDIIEEAQHHKVDLKSTNKCSLD